jgi:acetoin utilization deacetylase AcuC-like enzyme
MTQRIAVYYSPIVLRHDTGTGVFEAASSPLLAVAEMHPENARRLENMVSILKKGPLADRLDWREARPADVEQLARFHDAAHIEELRAIPQGESRRVTSTTVFGAGSWSAVCAAAGQAVAAVDHVWNGDGRLAYALVRPPGHHAQPTSVDGYCFANNIGVAIEEARAKGLRRAAVIDWDVHHGNGTQEGFYADPDVLTISLHMDHGAWGPNHLQTGAPEEVGTGAGVGANLNVALPFGSGDATYHAAFDRIVAPVVEDFEPELVVVACGQDASQFDPNGRQCVTMAGFHGLASRTRKLADRHCQGRLALVQEGGYAVSYAALCLHATLEGAMGGELSLSDPLAYLPEPTDHLGAVIDGIEQRWRRSVEAGRGR